MARNPLTAQHTLKFHEYMLYWQGVLSLGDWRIERSTKRAQKGALAEVHFDDEQRLVAYRIGDAWANPVTDDDLKETALHEMLHVLLHDPLSVAQDRTASPEQVGTAEHRVINLLERILMGVERADKDFG